MKTCATWPASEAVRWGGPTKCTRSSKSTKLQSNNNRRWEPPPGKKKAVIFGVSLSQPAHPPIMNVIWNKHDLVIGGVLSLTFPSQILLFHPFFFYLFSIIYSYFMCLYNYFSQKGYLSHSVCEMKNNQFTILYKMKISF